MYFLYIRKYEIHPEYACIRILILLKLHPISGYFEYNCISFQAENKKMHFLLRKKKIYFLSQKVFLNHNERCVDGKTKHV